MLIGAANLCCASPSPTVPDSLVIEAYQLYGRGDCATLRNRLERIDFSAVAIERQTPFDLLLAFCAEREGEILSAKDRYAALIAKAPRSGPAFEAALRLRELERLEMQGTTREELRKRADEARQSPLYEHGAKPLARELPDYPPGASAAGIEGEVLVDFAISRDGTVSDLVILASDPPFLFDGTALAAVRSWVYEPSDRDQPRRVSVRFPFATARPAENPMLVLTRVDESELDPIERRGRDIYEYSVAAGRAKAALVRSGHLSAFPNYIVVPDEDRSSVRFLDDQERVFADVVVDLFSPELERVTIHEVPIPLPADQNEMWRARVDALAFAKERHLTGCTENIAFVVLPSLESDRSWDVYILSVSTGARGVPTGGHYRISVSRDSKVSPALHAFAESCAPPTPSSDSGRLMITEANASTPTEVHVYLSLLYGRPLGVVVHDNGGRDVFGFVSLSAK